MDGDKGKEGFTVKEIEGFTKKHRIELVLILSFFLAMIFGHVFFSRLTLPLAGVGGILGVLFSSRVEHFTKKCFHFLFKQEQATQLTLYIVSLIVSIFLPPLILFIIGLHGGKSLHHLAIEMSQSRSKE